MRLRVKIVQIEKRERKKRGIDRGEKEENKKENHSLFGLDLC